MTGDNTILIIDDDDAIRRLCNRLLTRMGFGILEAENAQTGRSQFEQHATNLAFVLLDLHLPDGSGEALAGEFNTLQPDLPVVFFSGEVSSSKAEAEGPARYLLKKPFTRESLQTMLSEIGVSSTPSSE
jgi:DNA-binding NtrC family response regulator